MKALLPVSSRSFHHHADTTVREVEELHQHIHELQAHIDVLSGEIHQHIDDRANPLEKQNRYIISEARAFVAKEDVRFWGLYGDGTGSEDQKRQFFRDALGGRAIELMSTGEQIRTFAYISDCVAGLLSIVSAGATGEAYNVTNSSTPTSFADFARFVGETGKVPVRIPAKNETADNEPARPALYRVAQLSNAKLEALGWQPRFTAREAVDRTYTLLQLIR